MMTKPTKSSMWLRWPGAALMAMAIASQGQALAALQVQATRLIHQGASPSASLTLSNKSTLPYMAQTWLDSGDQSTMPDDLPMVIMPPLMRLEPGEEATLRTIYAGSGLPEDKESLLWINVQEIPPGSEMDNVLQFAIRTRIKLFYRPPNLGTTLDQAARSLSWRQRNGMLLVTNTSPLHITFVHVQGMPSAGPGKQIDLDMIAPGQSISTQLPTVESPSTDTLRFGYINDHGGVSEIDNVPLAH